MRLENPVLNRELIENLRSPRAFWMQAIFVAALGSLVLLAWPPQVELGLDETDKSIRIYNTFALGHLALLALLAPILSAPAIASERERASLDLLLTSPLPTRAIVTGKLFSAVVYLLLLSVSSLPIFSVCFLLGAVGWREIAATYLILFTAAFVCGAIGLAASTWMGRSRAALSVSYVIILPAILSMAMLNPMRHLEVALVLAFIGFGAGGLLVALVNNRLKKPFDTAPKSADEEEKDEQIGLVLDRQRFPDNLLSPRGSGKPLKENVNPVYEKELRYELFGRGTLLMRLLLQVSLLAALPFFIAALAIRGLWIYSYYVLVFILLLAPSLTAGIFTQERERGTIDMLLTTTLGWRRILRAKVLVSLRNIGILTAFLLPFMLLFWFLSLTTASLREDVLEVVGGFNLTAGTFFVLASTLLFVVMLTCFLSLICRTTLRSMVYTYLTLAFLFVLPVVLYQVLTDLGGYRPADVQWLGLTSPFYTLAAFESYEGSRPGLPFLRMPPGIAGRQLFLYVVLALSASTTFLGSIVLLFNRYCQFRHDRGL